MQKKVLSEIDLHYGKIDMPKGFEINRDKLQSDILSSQIKNSTFPYSRDWEKLNTYMREHIKVEHGFTLVNKETWGNAYRPKELSIPLLNIEPVDLRNSPDFTMLYGVKVDKCWVRIHFDDNRRKGRSWDIELKKNMFVMFPSTNMYIITNNHQDSLNFVQTITYEYI